MIIILFLKLSHYHIISETEPLSYNSWNRATIIQFQKLTIITPFQTLSNYHIPENWAKITQFHKLSTYHTVPEQFNYHTNSKTEPFTYNSRNWTIIITILETEPLPYFSRNWAMTHYCFSGIAWYKDTIPETYNLSLGNYHLTIII